ncbi:D-serine ammonia-lyase [Ureibacillus acetophenoni]|uniref:Probable D-serine dehydratase n=1 Tax=Ureibacillus acetophenoni TaxID=614649 RepID=A0A285U6S0_9BACL|nr:D-serine ammonia-lyase [Ureibacillus acetophenoni]SOC37532.1 D-serine ammonia-lyase [Ureibacillus acetophenoni]
MTVDNFKKLHEQYPLINEIKQLNTVFWENEHYLNNENNIELLQFNEVIDAKNRLERFAPYIQLAFPETTNSNGIIESEITEIPNMKKLIEKKQGIDIAGKLMLKSDHSLPISGSIKARGGIYEVLKHAETLAIENGLLKIDDDYSKLNDESYRKFFSNYKIAVGSTGNLGLSIGIMGAKLGFNVTVHMSSDAKEWKKSLLREKGVTVIEYESDYSKAVEEGRKQAESDPMCHFVDDENSKDLFVGYAVSAIRVQQQFRQLNIKVDHDHPLFVYLPCGVGGGPGGVAYGLKQIYGENVHIFFAEPIQSPCMLLGMMTGLHDRISVQDLGLSNKTIADGLAVGRASSFVGKVMEPILSGCYTVEDQYLLTSLREMYEQENIFMEPSAHAGLFGPNILLTKGKGYLKRLNLVDKMEGATHLAWSTGGNMVPEEQRQLYLNSEFV